MTRREVWLSAGGLFLLALVIRSLIASTIPFPTPEDTAYYYGVARNVVEGRGLVSDAIWSYGTPPLVFPRPAFEVWLPLPTLLAIIPMAILGTGFHAAQVATVILGSLVPVLAWRIAADLAAELELPVGRARTLAVGSGVTAAVSLPLLLHGVLPDSTTPYTVFSLAACLLMVRIIRELRGAQALDRRLLGLGVLFGLAALTRNEVVWLGLTWVAVAWWGARRMSPSWRSTLLRLVGVPAVVGLAILSPWLIRDWIVFGSPLPGQAATNALSITGFDIFAYADPPTLSRYLAQGPAFMVSSRVDGFIHNLFSVLLVPSFPVGLVGLVSLVLVRRVGTARSLRPLVLLSVLTFTATTLLFPVATTWGTFLHASGPIQVLLIVGCLAGLDAFIVRVGVLRGWTKPVAWLGPTLTVATSVLFSFALLGYAQQSRDVQERYAALGPALTAAGVSQDEIDAPVIADFPIWYAEGMRRSSLALPDEPPSDVISLAQRFGARLMVLSADGHGRWPAVIDAGPTGDGGPPAACFHEVHLTPPTDPAARDALSGTRVFRILLHVNEVQPMNDRPSPEGAHAGSLTDDAYTRVVVDIAPADADGRDNRFDGLHAEAKAVLGRSANDLRAVRDRYREAYHEELARWQAGRDELDGPDPDTTPRGDDEAGELGLHQSELSKLELAQRSLENMWLFLERGDSSLIGGPAEAAFPGDVQMRIVEAQEAERGRLAQEVHDGPAQALSNAIFQVEYIERVLDQDVRMARTELRFLRDLLRRELGDVRTFITQLRPPVLDQLGLDGAIADTAATTTALSGLPIETDLAAPADRLAEAEQTVVLRVVQEALQNVRKHAAATRVTVSSRMAGADWILEVRDDGRGFDAGAVAARGRRNFGLQFMRERAALIGARLEVRSRPAGGTVVVLAVPTGEERG